MALGQPGFFTQNPDGTITAEFAGHVSAAGIDLLAADNATPAADRKITWHKSTMTGAEIASVSSYNDSAAHLSTAALNVSGFTAADAAVLLVNATSNARAGGLSILQDKIANGISAITAALDNSNTSATIIGTTADGRGLSSFMRFSSASPQREHQINYGQQAFNWTGGTSLVNIGPFSHGLGVVPTLMLFVGATGGISGGNQFFTWNVGASTTTQYSLQGRSTIAPAAGADAFYWLAIG